MTYDSRTETYHILEHPYEAPEGIHYQTLAHSSVRQQEDDDSSYKAFQISSRDG
jgi:hypothetical protein